MPSIRKTIITVVAMAFAAGGCGASNDDLEPRPTFTHGNHLHKYAYRLADIDDEDVKFEPVVMIPSTVTITISAELDKDYFLRRQGVALSGPFVRFHPTKRFRVDVLQDRLWYGPSASCAPYVRPTASESADTSEWQRLLAKAPIRNDLNTEIRTEMVDAAHDYIIDPIGRKFHLIEQQHSYAGEARTWKEEIDFQSKIPEGDLDYAMFCFPTKDWHDIEGDFDMLIRLRYVN